MKRGERAGGGQSSLGYLFGSESETKQKNDQAAPPSPTTCMPPYGIDMGDDKAPQVSPNNTKTIYHRADGPNSGIFITGRPSTKVKSAPGGDSSLGYLFGDKS